MTHGYSDGDYRGIGVADMAWAIRNNRPHRCSAELGFHAFEVVHGIIESCNTGKVYEMTSSVNVRNPYLPVISAVLTQKLASITNQ